MRKSTPTLRSSARKATAWIALTALFYAPPGVPVARAGVEGEHVVAGEVSVERDGVLTSITASDGSIIEMDRLTVLADETLEFIQPSEAARVLNRVLGVDPTTIEGNLLANGRVYILNPQGVFFGGSAVVDVGRLVAAAGHISDSDFLAGVDHFTNLSGAVENRGTIQAGAVSLLGRSVANHGRIVAPDGMIAMVAGDEVFLGSLDGRVLVHIEGPAEDPGDWGVENSGTLDAGGGEVVLAAGDVYSLAANHTGITRGRQIRIAGGSGGLVQVAGALDASDASPGATGGSVRVTGDRVAVLDARIDASGDAGGGEVLIGGDVRGGGDLPTASRTWVGRDASLRADALREGDGGTVVVWSREATWSYGDISARGGAEGGDGGFAEISGGALVSRGSVDLGAPAGAAGTLLYDPTDIEIVGGSGDGSDAGDGGALGSGDVDVTIAFSTPDPPSGPFEIFESEIESTDANIQLEATRSVTTRGDFADDDVQLLPDRGLAISTSNASEDGGIDLTTSDEGADLVFRTQDGAIQISAGTEAAAGVTSEVVFGRIETGGGSAIVTNASGSITGASVDTTGPGAAGAIALVAQGRAADPSAGTDAVRGDVTVTGALIARGADATEPDARGGDGGDVQVRALGGAIHLGARADGTSVDTSGGSGSASGGGAGTILLDSEGIAALGATFEADPENPAGPPVPVSPGRDLLAGGLQVDGDLLARGGDGATGGGGGGGLTQIAAVYGSVDLLGSVDSSGGHGQLDGGDAAAITIYAEGAPASAPVTEDVANPDDPEGDPLQTIVVREGTAAAAGNVTVAGDLVAVGGEGVEGVGGEGGVFEQVGVGSTTLGASVTAVGGAISLASVDVSGGRGKTGGNAGRILLTASGFADPTPEAPADGLDAVTSGATASGAFTARGGASTGPDAEDEDNGVPRFRGGNGGTVAVQVSDGSIALGDVDASGGEGERAGDGADIVIEARGTGDVALTGTLVTRGGAGTKFGERRAEGGDGGSVGVSAVDDGDVTAGSIDASGGAGEDGGGAGGDINVAALGEVSGAGDLHLDGALAARGGESLEGESDGGTVFLGAIGSVLGRVAVSGDLIIEAAHLGALGAARTADNPLGVAERLEIEGEDLADHTLFLFSTGDSAVGLEAETFGTLDVTQRLAAADLDVALAGGSWIRADGRPASGIVLGPDGTSRAVPAKSTLSADTEDQPIALVYRLEEAPAGTDPFPQLVSGSLRLGADTELTNLGDVLVPADSIEMVNDAALAIRADTDRDGAGSVVASSDGVQVVTTGDVTLEGVSIGAERAFRIRRSGIADRTLALVANGDVDVAVDVSDPDVGEGHRGFATIAVDQFDTDGSIDVIQGPEGERDTIHIGPAVDDAIADIGIDTLAHGAGLLLRIQDTTPQELRLPTGGVALGGDSSFSNLGDIVLGDAEGVAVAMEEGASLALESREGAIRDGVAGDDGSARISMSADGAGAGGLVLEAALGVGDDDDPIEVQGIGDLAGAAAGGSFAVTNRTNGSMRIAEVAHPEPGRTGVRGISADGNVVLRDRASETITIAGDFEDDHVSAVGDVLLDAAVRVEDDASIASLRGDVRFASTVDAVSDGGASLTVSAPGTITWGGAIGDDQRLADLSAIGSGVSVIEVGRVRTTGSQFFLGGASLVEDTTFVAGGSWSTGGALEGAGQSASVEAVEKVTFGGDVGASAPLRRLEVRTPGDLVFTGAETVRAEEAVLLNPEGRAEVLADATIYKLGGNLAFETDHFEVGRREKIAVGGALQIRAGVARFGDVSARSLDVQAPEIELLAREAGPAFTTDGVETMDDGLDLVANRLRLSSVPIIVSDSPSDSPVVTLASQDGTIAIPDPTGFQVRLIDPEGGGVTSQNLQQGDRVVDLLATGPEAVGDSASVIPRPEPQVTAWVAPRFGNETPALSMATPSADEVLAYLQCADIQTGTHDLARCLAPVAADESDLPTFDYRALHTERARDAARLYRELLGTAPGVEAQRVAFDDAFADYRLQQASGEVDGAAFYQFLDRTGRLREARDYVDHLAQLLTELQLLDLSPGEAQGLREQVAANFTEALGAEGLSAPVLLDAVDASRVGLPR